MGLYETFQRWWTGTDKIQPKARYQATTFTAPENASAPENMRPETNVAIENSRKAALLQQNQTKSQ